MLVLDCVDSTNNYAMAMVQKGQNANEKAVFAMQQTAGKGRREKIWRSNKGENILLSIPIKMNWLPVSQQFSLSAAVALACFDLLSQFVLANLFIKWPNDLFINDKKTGGILIETILRGNNWQWAIIGVGMNINQQVFEELPYAATSLKLETGSTFDVLKLAEELHQLVLKRITELKTIGFITLLQEYNRHLYAAGRKVKLKKQNVLFETTIAGVSATGQLITMDSIERRFDFDEVEFKGIVGQ